LFWHHHRICHHLLAPWDVLKQKGQKDNRGKYSSRNEYQKNKNKNINQKNGSL
jgi:hypothetical protein